MAHIFVDKEYYVNCSDISSVRLLRSRIYKTNEEVSDIELIDKSVFPDFQRANNSDRYNAKK
ncbi:hypothetical protein DSM106972_052310 [Dulcicalothrix desertica PCC 7102]|uniref:Uncharacterized protein n=1 Tax=Dulcicalothrix desertica PCC 7102 TaxID=232991 RepID=A0A433VBW2_9CYAN|nr:hypothetical protein DSM106972_052310 [Dulcicalothrix desertica PCC 7102]